MTQPKASTLQQRFGFQDSDLKSPDHDQIMIWLDTYAEEIVKLILKYDGNWENQNDPNIKHLIERIGEPPEKPSLKIKKVWEYAVTGRNGFMVGFIDMLVEVDLPYLDLHREKWMATSTRTSVFFEVKTTIPSLGELIRQIRMYQEYIGKRKFYVVASDSKYVKQLNQQGIGFIKYPDFQIFDE
jgi:hypothetical protein